MRLQIGAVPLAVLGLAATMGAAGTGGPAAAAASPPVPVAPIVETVPDHSPTVSALTGATEATGGHRLEIGGHRGGVDQAPENTLAAVRKAIEAGADAVELDVRFTADGRPVILHDDTLERTTNCSGPVSNWRLSSLLRCDAGTWFGRAFGDERVPTLAEVLDELDSTDLVLYVHVKLVDTLAQAATLVSAVSRSGMTQRQVVFVADEHERLAMLALAGVPRERLAWVVHHEKDWTRVFPRWGSLVVHCPKVTRAMVARAQARGQRVIAVEGFPITRAQASKLKLDGFLADNLQAALAFDDREAVAAG